MVTLITVDDIKTVTSIPSALLEKGIEPYIPLGELQFVYPILGDALLSELQSQITGNTLTTQNLKLLTEYITPLSAYAAWLQYTIPNAYRSSNKGETKKTSDNSDSISPEELVLKRNDLKDKISVYENQLRKYLDGNKTQYPLYRSDCTVGKTFSTGIFLNYD